MVEAANSSNATLIMVAVIGALASAFAAYLGYRGKKLGEAAVALATETKVIATETRSMSDGRLTAMVAEVDELKLKLAVSENRVSNLVATEVGKTATEVLARAADKVSRAEETAATLVQRAEERAVAVIAEALRVAPRPRGRRS